MGIATRRLQLVGPKDRGRGEGGGPRNDAAVVAGIGIGNTRRVSTLIRSSPAISCWEKCTVFLFHAHLRARMSQRSNSNLKEMWVLIMDSHVILSDMFLGYLSALNLS